MCYFLCLSLPYDVQNISQIFGGILSFEDASTAPIGETTRGNRTASVAYVITNGGCSCCIMGQTHNKRQYCPTDFIESLRRLLGEVPSVSLLVHAFRADWRIEEVPSKGKRLITLGDFAFPDIEENIRYVLISLPFEGAFRNPDWEAYST